MTSSRTPSRTRTRAATAEQGHLMAGVMVLLALMIIFSTVVFQGWEDVMRRDSEAEMMFRAEEIVRAIVRFRTERGATPAKLEELIEPGQRGQYYIRKLYKDPLVEDGRWGLLYVGPGGEVIDPNGEAFDATQAGLGDAAITGATGSLTRDQRAALARSRKGARGVDPRRFTGSGAAAGIESEMAGGRQLAGLQIAGVKSLSTEDAFRVYNGYFEYSQWHFTFLDLEKQKLPGGGAPGAGGRRGGGPGRDRGGFDRSGGADRGGTRGRRDRSGGRGNRGQRGRR